MATKKQLIERWQNVLRVLRALTPHQRKKRWNMGSFGYETECGTVACAAGHCGMDPWFRRRGVRLEPRPVGTFGVHPKFSGQKPLEILPKFFGPDGYEAIFSNGDHRPVSKVIREVRAHIKTLQSEGDHGK